MEDDDDTPIYYKRDQALSQALTHHAQHGHVSETASPKETVETAALFLTFLTTGA